METSIGDIGCMPMFALASPFDESNAAKILTVL
jgi:hypothetical protein